MSPDLFELAIRSAMRGAQTIVENHEALGEELVPSLLIITAGGRLAVAGLAGDFREAPEELAEYLCQVGAVAAVLSAEAYAILELDGVPERTAEVAVIYGVSRTERRLLTFEIDREAIPGNRFVGADAEIPAAQLEWLDRALELAR